MKINSNFFSYISFSVQNIYMCNNIFKTKITIGKCVFPRYMLTNGLPILNLENLQNFT